MTNLFSLARRLAPAALLALALLPGCNGPDRSQPAAAPGEWALLNFTKVDSINPILGPSPVGVFQDPILRQPVRWEEKDVFNPAVVVKDGKMYMLYRAENLVTPTVGKTSRIGLARSADGVHFTRMPAPVLLARQ